VSRPIRALSASDRERLLGILTESQALGFLGPGRLDDQIDHSLAFTSAVLPPGRALDLGSGGGVPGLVLALAWPDTSWILLDGSVRRSQFLSAVTHRLGLDHRVEAVSERAEVAGQGPLRGSQDVVVARGFGPPAVTAECAAPFLRVEGSLVVAEPPGGLPGRWRHPELGLLGMEPAQTVTEPVALQVLRQASPCPARYPRRVGIPAKRPLFV
jgi:16S rRNA (guanine527-N7)-methyltransferase